MTLFTLRELRLVPSQAMEGTLTVDEARSEARRLKSEYEARVEHWTNHPPCGLEKTLFGRARDPRRVPRSDNVDDIREYFDLCRRGQEHPNRDWR